MRHSTQRFLFALLTLLCLPLGMSASDFETVTISFTQVKGDGEIEALEDEEVPESGLPVMRLSDKGVTAFTLDAFKAVTSGDVSSVIGVGTLYNSSDTPDPDSWVSMPLPSTGDNTWGLGNIGVNLVSGLTPGNTYIFEFYLKGVDGEGTSFLFNNGGENYKIRFKVAGDDTWTVKLHEGETAGLSITADGNPMDITFTDEWVRTPAEEPATLELLTLNGWWIWVERRTADYEFGTEGTSLQYKVYEQGTEGGWNTVHWTMQEDVDGDILQKKFVGSDQSIDLLADAEDGKTYVVEVCFQVVSSDNSIYNMYGRDEDTTKFTFTKVAPSNISELATDGAAAAPAYNLQGMRVDDSYRGIVVKGGKKFIRK